MKKLVNLIIIPALLLAAFFYLKGAFLSEQGKIKRIVSKGERAIEKKDIIGAIRFVSPEYSDSFGNDRRSLMFLAERAFNEYQNIFLHIQSLTVELCRQKEIEKENNLAEVKFIAKIMVSKTEGEKKELFIEKGSERFLVIFRKEDGKWKVFQAEIPEYQFD